MNNIRGSFDKWVTKRRHSIKSWNRKNPKYTFCGEFNFERTQNFFGWRHHYRGAV